MPTPEQGKPRKAMTTVVLIALVAVLAYALVAVLMGSWPFGEPAATPAPTPTPTPSVTGPAAGQWESHGSIVVQGFELRTPANMTFQETPGQDPADPAKKWTTLTLIGAGLEGRIAINYPYSLDIKPAEPVTTGAVGVGGMTVTYRTGLYERDGQGTGGQPGPERVWVGEFSASGDSYQFALIAEDGTDRTELVNTILATFEFPPAP
jgi:hypothetical protein